MIESYNIHLGYAVASLSLLMLQYSLNASKTSTSQYVQYIKPSQIALFYIFSSYLIGSIFLYLGISYFENYLKVPQTWSWFNFWIWFCTMLFALIATSSSQSWFLLPTSVNRHIALKVIILTLLAILISRFLIFGLLIWVGILFYLITNKVGMLRFIVFMAVSLISLVFVFYGSKRFIIFPLIIAFLYMSAVKPPPKLYVIFIVLLVIFLILAMSILRGYGGGSGMAGFSSYFGNDLVWQMIGNNFEFVYFYFHGVNSTEMIFKNSDYLLGESFLKGLLFGWNYLGLNHGFQSTIDIYTSLFSANTRQSGGSYPINIYSEFFMNFGFLVLFIFPTFLWWVDFIFRKSLRIFGDFKGSYFNLTILLPWLFWVRGSSVDLFIYYLFFGLFAAYLVFIIMSLKLRF